MKKLTDELRGELKIPFGELISEEEFLERVKDNGLIMAIGDVCLITMLEKGLEPSIAVYDLKSEREKLEEKDAERILKRYGTSAEKVENPAGFITEALEKAVIKAIESKKGAVFVDGEEDLAGLVAIANAPEKSAVVYGQPGEGIVYVSVDENKRKKAREMIDEMEDV